MAILRLIRGYPGAGKSTAAKRLFPGTLLIENDQFLIQNGKYKWSKERVTEAIHWCINVVDCALKNSFDVCVCNTFTKQKFIQRYKDLADEYNADFQVYRCIGNFQNVHGLDEKMVQNFKNAMEDWSGEIIVEPV